MGIMVYSLLGVMQVLLGIPGFERARLLKAHVALGFSKGLGFIGCA